MSVKRLTPNKIANLVMADDAWHDSEYVAAADYDAAVARIAKLEAAKDGAYLERNQCVALIARMATALGYWAGKAKTAIDGWSEDWHGCVYIDLPAGQVSWHYHDTQAHLFDWLPPYCGEWDGHEAAEKYRRVLDRATMPNARAERAEADAEIGRKWRADSSLETWFPYTAEELTRLRAELAAALADAERYRELRRLTTTWPTTVLVVNYNIGHTWHTADAPDEIDGVLDDAIAARGAT